PRPRFEADPPPGRWDFGSFATTRSYDVLTSSVSSRRSSVSPSSSSITHMLRAMYGAGMMPGRSTSSANDSGVHLNATWCGGSRLTTTNIFLPIQKQRSWPHLMSSVTWGRAPQMARTVSSVMGAVITPPSPLAGLPASGDGGVNGADAELLFVA